VIVSWTDAVAYAKWLTERTGTTYRLPTEAEWEYACRAATDSPWSFGDDPDLLGDYAWLNANSGSRAHPVAEKRPNPWGLHDMHGNVWEWCWDRYGAYSSRPVSDPHGPVFNRRRVLRGGSFFVSPESLRSASRDDFQPELRFRHVGFRCVRVPARQH
jgi:formylglycine-generating enzyme required for sulfatase activity